MRFKIQHRELTWANYDVKYVSRQEFFQTLSDVGRMTLVSELIDLLAGYPWTTPNENYIFTIEYEKEITDEHTK